MTESSKPPSGRRMKVPAPSPPQAPQPAPRHLFRNPVPDGGGMSAMDVKENILRPTVDFQLTLPGGYQVSETEDGSKALMDLLVDLCGRHRLNPSLHTLELLSPEGHSLGFKPNALLGSFNVACVLIKEKVVEEKVTRRPAPKAPEKTVRLMVNYHGNQKAVVRVNPLVPLQALIPAICDKCDFDAAHVLLLKDAISRHELPLDKSLTELGIRELYVHDQTLVLQPKMASAPALNNSDPMYSSTASLGRPQKKGLLNIFSFSKRKSKSDRNDMDMEDFDENAIQNSDTKSKGISTVSGVSYVEGSSGSLEQSRSFTDISTMHAKAESKKRRAPAPPVVPTSSQRNPNFKNNQEVPGSEGQRKRKAPPPPPTPSSLAQDSDDSSAPVSISNPQGSVIPTPVPRTKTPPPPKFSDASVIIQAAEAPPGKTAPKPPPVRDATPPLTSPSPSSPTPSSSTSDSLAVQDSSSELSRSLDDSDVDLDQAGSRCSTSSTAESSLQVEPATKKSSTTANQPYKGANSDSSSRSDSESALNLKLDEAENNRHSGMAWLHSRKTSSSFQKQETPAPEAETLSLDSNSFGSSLPDQGYTSPEGATEAEDSGIVSSPSDTQTTSPHGSLSEILSGERGERRNLREVSSDSEEENTTWAENNRHNLRGPNPQPLNGFKDNSELTVQLHQTLADAGLADEKEDIRKLQSSYNHSDITSVRESPDRKSTDSSEVPVSVVDMDVPVTAIDEVLEEYERDFDEYEVKSLTKTESTKSEGQDFSHHSNEEKQNKNNNAYTAAFGYKTGSASSDLPKESSAPQEIKTKGVKKEKKAHEIKMKEKRIADTTAGKEDTQRLSRRTSADLQKSSKPPIVSADPVKYDTHFFKQKKSELPAKIQRSVSPERDEAMQKVNQISSGFSPSHGKIKHNVPSRFGMKTFTVVPPKPSITYVAETQPAAKGSNFAIKIDDQGNMVGAGLPYLKSTQSSKSEIENTNPVCENAKEFWTSNIRQEHVVTQRKRFESTDVSSNASAACLEGKSKTSNTESQKTATSDVAKLTTVVQTKVEMKEDHKQVMKDASLNRECNEVESKISGSNNVQRPSNTPSLPPPLQSDRKQQLNFVKPSRRTSSQYVASALAKYTPKTSAKPSSIPKITDSSETTRTEKAAGFQKSLTHFQSSQLSLTDITENDSTGTVTVSCPQRSMSFPEYMSESQRDSVEVKINRERFKNNTLKKKEGLDTAEQKTDKKNDSRYNGSPQIHVISNSSDYVKHIQRQISSPAKSTSPQPSFKPPIAPKIKLQQQISEKDDLKEIKLASSAIVSDSTDAPGSIEGVTVFGPVKKFKPVICRSVEKETSLHSSLMEAIQTGGGKERLRKISTTTSNEKKIPCADESDERSALLSALRCPNVNRLKKTKSKAASEVERFRKESSGEGKTETPPYLTRSSPLTPPPPPPISAPPPAPPPVFPQGKANTVGHLNANASMNPALAREALLEAIRSGSGAERLRKVSSPKKTVQVNGRLGTIQH
ncbi:PREDICTED: protein cordon-bleu-like isoform X3 [Cyprinodon variegatus]|uniref:protein cordon-bleu-like isoform X3 n=1 Tax=Cyprinodon variegatus TaxID=28743 RepID=UPI00074296F9|nr:PREDICTED: protein cordon-bleu-like isoform X3 [Cyprinodon variegatus]